MEFDNKKWKVYTWKNWMMIHWMINPGLAINELILGQRVPKISLVDKESNKHLIERTYIPCPHCEKLHDGRTWSTQNKTAFKNWFGLYCNNCGNVIPCLTNIFSLIILIITFPIWGWFKNSLKKNWLKKQPKRFTNINTEKLSNSYEGRGWLKQGLSFGFLMYIFMTIFFPLMTKEEITQTDLLIGIPIWLVGGLGFGYIMKLMMNKKEKEFRQRGGKFITHIPNVSGGSGVSGVYIEEDEETEEIEEVADVSGVYIDSYKEPYYLFFDTETTGVPNEWNAPLTAFSNWPRLVQLAFLLYDAEGSLILSNETVIKPSGFSIPKDASDVHGITTDYALNNGKEINDVLSNFEEQCLKSKYLVAHNINFDSKVMGSEFLRNTPRNPISKLQLLCTMEASTDFCKIEGYYGYKWPKLSELHIKLFGVDFEGAHDALADIEATARCFWEMRKLKLI